MYKGYRTIGIIPARGTNDEVDHLNIKQLGGRPMLVHSIEKALKAVSLDALIVSTEDRKTAKIAEKAGALVPFLRPPELSRPDAALVDVVKHAFGIFNSSYDIAVTLLPNSPFRTDDDIDRAVALLVDGGYDSIISVVEERDFYWIVRDGNLEPLTHTGVVSRRECKPIYRMAGGMEVCWTANYKKRDYLGSNVGFYTMEEHNAMTVNTIYDLLVAERLVKLPGSLIRELIKSG